MKEILSRNRSCIRHKYIVRYERLNDVLRGLGGPRRVNLVEGAVTDVGNSSNRYTVPAEYRCAFYRDNPVLCLFSVTMESIVCCCYISDNILERYARNFFPVS